MKNAFRRQGRLTIASHADVLRGSSRVPAPQTLVGHAGTRDEPPRTSAWEASMTTNSIREAERQSAAQRMLAPQSEANVCQETIAKDVAF